MASSSSSCGNSYTVILFFVSILLLIINSAITTVVADNEAHHQHHSHRNRQHGSVSVPIYVFGDSTVDPGNNNYINTVAKSNFPPYGRDLIPSHIPTGRFCNGKLIPDFIASYLGIKELVPPYLDSTLSFQDLMSGVSFASAATGYDPFTSQVTRAIPMLKQLDYFTEYKARLEAVIGKKITEDHIQKAMYFISAGTNDFVLNYFSIPIRRQTFTVTNYQNFLIKNTLDFLQGLWNLGARRIVIVGLPPIGCLPFLITFKSNTTNILKRECIDTYSSVTRVYNKKLEGELVFMQQRFANYGGLILYVDIYNPLKDIIDNYNKFGFEEWKRGCCGTGLIELSMLCNPNSLVCPDASKYVFWDSLHPSEKTYYIVFIIAFRNILHLLLAH